MSSLPLFIKFTLFIFVSILWFFIIFCGIGLFARRIFGFKTVDSENLWPTFWVGWSFAILFLQIWHFWFPVNSFALLSICTSGIFGMLWNSKDVYSLIKKRPSINTPFVFLVLFVSLLISTRAIPPPLNFDSGRYHLTAIRWAKSFPIVPGLGNLQATLAHPISYFLYVATIDHGPWLYKSYHLANALLLFALCAQIFTNIFGCFRKKGGALSIYLIFNIFLMAPILKLIFFGDVSSPNTDTPVFILGVVLAMQLLRFIEKPGFIPQENAYDIFCISSIVIAGIVTKSAFFAFGITTLLVSFFAYSAKVGNTHAPSDKKTPYLFSLIIILAGLIPWVIRNIILSGYIIYPLSSTALPVDWRIPRASVINAANGIRGWARMPLADWDVVLEGWDWFQPWAKAVFLNTDVATPLFLLGIAGILIFFSLRKQQMPHVINEKLPYLILFPPLASLAYWFIMAPDLRFAGSCFWILGIGGISIAIGHLKKQGPILKLYILLLLGVVILENFLITGERNFQFKIASYNWLPIPKKDFGPDEIPKVELATFITNSGLVLYVPKQDDQCWDAPLPCTIYPNPSLCLRKPNNMRHGFTVYPRDENDGTVGFKNKFKKNNEI